MKTSNNEMIPRANEIGDDNHSVSDASLNCHNSKPRYSFMHDTFGPKTQNNNFF